jgi:putative ABC transport system substrate-binding protein
MWCSTLGVIVIFTSSVSSRPRWSLPHSQREKCTGSGGSVLALPALIAPPPVDAFRQGLRELGYVEGQNLVMEYRGAEGQDERLPDLAAKLARLQVEVIVAVGTAATHAAQHATHTIPIVMMGTPDPVGQGLVASLARPGGNITGVSLLMAELPGKRLEYG